MQVLVSESKNDELNKSDLDKQWDSGACFVHEYNNTFTAVKNNDAGEWVCVPYIKKTQQGLQIYSVRWVQNIYHAREPLYSNSAVIAWWSQSTSGKNGVFMCTLLLKKVINFLIFYF